MQGDRVSTYLGKYGNILTLCMLGNFAYIFVVCGFFFKINFYKKIFQEYHRVSNNLDLDQAGHFVGPDLGPNCLQKLSADDKNCH